MKTKLLAVMVVFGASAVLATAGGDDAKKDMEKLKGTWKLTSETDSGQNIPVDPNEVFVFDGEKLTNKVGSKVTDEFKVKIVGAGKSPKEIDLIPEKDPNKGVAAPGIYKLEGKDDKLTICINFAPGSKRPTGFESNQQNRNIILVMQKMEGGKKDGKDGKDGKGGDK
jgi:uncharacterized protein (TIGR03067 family)